MKTEYEVDDFLRDLLSDGPKPAHAIFATGATCGFGDRQLRRAADRLGIVRDGPPDARIWYLSGHRPDTRPDTMSDASGAPAAAGVRTPPPPTGERGSCPDTPSGRGRPRSPTDGPFYEFWSDAAKRMMRFRSSRPCRLMTWPPADFVPIIEIAGRKVTGTAMDGRDSASSWRYIGDAPAPDAVPCSVGVCMDCLWRLGDAGRLVRIPNDPDLPGDGRDYAAECGVCDPMQAYRATLATMPPRPVGFPPGTVFAWLGGKWVAGTETDGAWSPVTERDGLPLGLPL